MQEAGRMIREGGLVAFPTETVYGLGANGLDARAVAGIYEAKGRPADNPMILHVASLTDAKALSAHWSENAQRVANKLWPGPVTVVVPAAKHIPGIVTAGLDTVAIRFPADPVALALIEASGVPIAAPSANTSGRPSPTRAEHVLEDMDGKIDVIIDGGPCRVGIESTIIDLSVDPPEILRPGDVTREALRSALGGVRIGAAGEAAKNVIGEAEKAAATDSTEVTEGRTPKAPGMKYRHYAPKAPTAVLVGETEVIADYISRVLHQNNDANEGEEGAETEGFSTVDDAVCGAVCGAIKAVVDAGKTGTYRATDPLEKRKTGLLLSAETWKIMDVRGLKPNEENPGFYCRNMGSRLKPKEMGLLLYDALRACDRADVSYILIEACSGHGQGEAILNRLQKAAGGRMIDVSILTYESQ